jgi:Fe2+ or Zn2+ uptake regulation protein
MRPYGNFRIGLSPNVNTLSIQNKNSSDSGKPYVIYQAGKVAPMNISESMKEYEKILASYKIESTPVRITLLLIIHKHFKAEFTITGILQLLEKEKLNVSASSVITTIGLFKMRGLVEQIEATGDSEYFKRVGRPQKKLICVLNKQNSDEKE